MSSPQPEFSATGFTLPGTSREVPFVPATELVNQTAFPSALFTALDQYGEAFHVVTLRISYDMDGADATTRESAPLTQDRRPVLGYAAEQSPLVAEDAWSGAPNESSPLWESDYAPYKPRCDVLVVHAVSRPPMGEWQRAVGRLVEPDQAPQAQAWHCGVSLQWLDPEAQAQQWSKQLRVTGPRRCGLLGVDGPTPATEVPIDWLHAYGGQDKQPAQDERTRDGSIRAAGSSAWHTDERNPVGCGFRRHIGDPLPQVELGTEAFGGLLTRQDFAPASLGPLGRAWLPRRLLAGTTDEAWLQTQWPLIPQDFDFAYWNCAPADQQVPYLPPGTRIRLTHLHSPQAGPISIDQETWTACLPARHPCVLWRLASGVMLPRPLHLDTLVVDLKARQIYATHRAVMSAKVDVRQVDALLMPWPTRPEARHG